MRAFCNAILAVIGASSLTDLEWMSISIDVPTYTSELYLELLAVLDSREAVSEMRDRLRFAFLSRGIDVPTIIAGQSNIFVGSVLD